VKTSFNKTLQIVHPDQLKKIHQDLIRVRYTLWHLARSLPTLFLSHGYKIIRTSKAGAVGSQSPQEMHALPLYAGTYTGARRKFLQNMSVCSDFSPSMDCDPTIIARHAKKPQGRVDFVKHFWLTPADMAASRQEDG